MRRNARRPFRIVLAAITAPLLFGCGSSFWMPPPPSPAEIPRLEAQVSRDAADVGSAVRLAQAYRAADRLDDARPLLERTVDARPDEPTAAFLLGLTYEDLGMYAEARRLYRAYIEEGSSPELRRELERRMPLLQRWELEAAVRASLEREAALADLPSEPWTVAVFPFEFVGEDPEFGPLGRALAEMFVTDLSQTDRLRVLERARVQFLLDELRLAEEGRVDPTTAVRAGRILGAERAVHGSMDGGDPSLRLEATIVRVTDAAWPGEAEPEIGNLRRLSDADDLRAFFDMQKRVALQLYASLGVELTAAERERVTRRPTENLMAILAYGRGLASEDAGDFAAAARHFAEAAALDPAFDEAREASERTQAAAEGQGTGTGQLAERIDWDLPPPVIAEFALPNPVVRDPAPEILGTEGLAGGAILEIIIRRP
jgi:tetratricopeptide (TPR) repeat protein